MFLVYYALLMFGALIFLFLRLLLWAVLGVCWLGARGWQAYQVRRSRIR